MNQASQESHSPSATRPAALEGVEAVLATEDLVVRYGTNEAVKKVSIRIPDNQVTAIIGPSGCGKSTYLRTLNRMNDFVASVSIDGKVFYRGTDLYGPDVDAVEVRRRIGMVFQKPNPFPKTIFKNIAWGPTINGVDKREIPDLVEDSLRKSALWEEVKDRLHDSALGLSGGQQQRLCIARSLAMHPEIILMDEPCSALDPVSTGKIEDLIFKLKKRYCIVIVTHNMQQAARVSDYTAFLEAGHLVEFGETDRLFTNPMVKRTEEYVTGRFG